ncbi:MAG: permease prefix domain 1-containing protein [Candidatus Faecousia sp.]|nr:permease prefix domain 1-containing protein [Clostridiales bacterium]MDY6180661.1 permease prefix domain 1-containing protein [Candidatus Faecousia sp.]
MRDQLIQYVTLLFAGAQDCADTKQEILQNTLDRYDDLVAQGKSPEAAYRLAISGIGDINEILGGTSEAVPVMQSPASEIADDGDSLFRKLLRAVAIGLYILCPIPLFVLGELGMDTIGLCGTIALVAVATVLILLGRKKSSGSEKKEEDDDIRCSPRQELRKGVNSLIWAIGLAVYFIISFATMAWYVTWVIFPIIAAVQGLVRAILDLVEVNHHEI